MMKAASSKSGSRSEPERASTAERSGARRARNPRASEWRRARGDAVTERGFSPSVCCADSSIIRGSQRTELNVWKRTGL